jgi:hypothetical protein
MEVCTDIATQYGESENAVSHFCQQVEMKHSSTPATKCPCILCQLNMKANGRFQVPTTLPSGDYIEHVNICDHNGL